MRKSLSHFLLGVLFIFITIHTKGIDVSTVIKPAPVFSNIKIQLASPQRVYPIDSNSLVKDSLRRGKHRLVAALLAFPLGVLGLHRMYLGTSALVPVIYIVTIGGVFGVLPFIDFVLILLSKDIHKSYINNHHLFMWQKNSSK